jgi:hypothetical protein
MRKVTILSVLATLLAGLFVSNSFAATVATAAVTPSITAPGGKDEQNVRDQHYTASNANISTVRNCAHKCKNVLLSSFGIT